MTNVSVIERVPLDPAKFRSADITADGKPRAAVSLTKLKTLWINTGTLCNIECVNCYIDSSPTNDRLVYITASEVASYLDEIEELQLGTQEIGLTGGEPFMNPDCCTIIEAALERELEVLVLTNAMQPMLRSHIRQSLLTLNARYGQRLTLRVSLDHYSKSLHESQRGPKSWDKTLEGLKWLSNNGFHLNVAGRTCWGETEAQMRAGYAALFVAEQLSVDAAHPAQLVLFPEMDETIDVAEITVDCWDLLGKNPNDMMCATSRMIVKRRGEPSPVVLSCTLLPYGIGFEMGARLKDAQGAVKLNHPHCSRFCLLGDGLCSVAK